MEALLCIALSNAVAATLLAVIAAAASRVCRRPAVLHALWLLVLLKLLTPPLVPLPLTWLETADETPPAMDRSPSEEPIGTVVPVLVTKDEPSARESDPAPVGVAIAVLLKPAVMVLWLGGSLAWWTIAGARLVRFHRLLRQAQVAPEIVQKQGQHLAALLGLRRCPPVLLLSAPLSPMLWALGLSPRLLMPADLWQRLSCEQQDTLLAHELVHLRRGDHWVRRLEFLVLGLYWWHPVVWWAQRRLQEAEEECCDARVVAVLPDAAPAYASALVETVTFLAQTHAASLIGASGAGQIPVLKRRLTMILTTTSSGRPTRAAFWSVLGLGALLLPLAPGAVRTEAPEHPQDAESKSQPEERKHETELRMDLDPYVKLRLHAGGMQNCAVCHEPQSVKLHDWLGKPQSWRHTHDEVVRLMDEVQRAQTRLREAKKNLPLATEGDRTEQIEKLQDEIELLKVEVRLKEIHLQAAKGTLATANRRLHQMNEQNRRVPGSPGSVPPDEIRSAQSAVEKEEFDVRIKEAELQKTLVHLKQAERRLARLQSPKDRSAAAGGEGQAQKLRELEHKVESLLKEIHNLRREMQPDKQRSP